MSEVTKIQKATQAFQLTAAIMIAIRAGIRLRAEIERAVLQQVDRLEVDSDGDVPSPLDMSGVAALVKRMQESLNQAVKNANREAEGRD